MSIAECIARADEILTTPGSGDDPMLTLELTKCTWGADAELPEVSPEEQFAYDTYVERHIPRSGSRPLPASISPAATH